MQKCINSCNYCCFERNDGHCFYNSQNIMALNNRRTFNIITIWICTRCVHACVSVCVRMRVRVHVYSLVSEQSPQLPSQTRLHYHVQILPVFKRSVESAHTQSTKYTKHPTTQKSITWIHKLFSVRRCLV